VAAGSDTKKNFITKNNNFRPIFAEGLSIEYLCRNISNIFNIEKLVEVDSMISRNSKTKTIAVFLLITYLISCIGPDASAFAGSSRLVGYQESRGRGNGITGSMDGNRLGVQSGVGEEKGGELPEDVDGDDTGQVTGEDLSEDTGEERAEDLEEEGDKGFPASVSEESSPIEFLYWELYNDGIINQFSYPEDYPIRVVFASDEYLYVDFMYSTDGTD